MEVRRKVTVIFIKLYFIKNSHNIRKTLPTLKKMENFCLSVTIGEVNVNLKVFRRRKLKRYI